MLFHQLTVRDAYPMCDHPAGCFILTLVRSWHLQLDEVHTGEAARKSAAIDLSLVHDLQLWPLHFYLLTDESAGQGVDYAASVDSYVRQAPVRHQLLVKPLRSQEPPRFPF